MRIRQLTSRIAKKIILVEVAKGRHFITQGTANRDLFFILAGACALEVNGREIATRRAKEHVGEIALLDTVALRSASVRATEQTVLARISPHDFVKIAKQYPDLWRRMAMTLGNRLRERNKFQQAPHEQPSFLLGHHQKEAFPLLSGFKATQRDGETFPDYSIEFGQGVTQIDQLQNEFNEKLYQVSQDTNRGNLITSIKRYWGS